MLGLMLALIVFAMQIQSFCDPFAVVKMRRQWRDSKDIRAFVFTAALCAGYYAFTLCCFAVFLLTNGFNWSSAMVAHPQQVRATAHRGPPPLSIHGWFCIRGALQNGAAPGDSTARWFGPSRAPLRARPHRARAWHARPR
eukprot:6243352-Prymnesium_polylepis.1